MVEVASPSPPSIDVWCTFFDEIDSETLLAEYRSLLSDDERQQERRFYFEIDRRRYLVTRALVRTVLSRYAAVDPRDWVFTTNSYGRPVVAAPLPSTEISFNISHTNSLIALVVTSLARVGVDVENSIRRAAPLEIADAYFAPAEVDELLALPQEQRQQRFFQYWTLKESYIKARGMGLSIPLDKFHYAFREEGSVALTVAPELKDAAAWCVWQYRIEPCYLLALCCERTSRVTRTVCLHKVVPLRNHVSFEAELLCASQR